MQGAFVAEATDYSETVIDEQLVVFQWVDQPASVDLLTDRIATRADAQRMIDALTAAMVVLK